MSDERGGEQRRRELTAIHIAKAATRMSDENYRLLVGQITGGRSDSAGKMDSAERRTLLRLVRRPRLGQPGEAP